MMSTSLNVIKYMLFLFNVLFVMTGLVLLSIGATIKAVYWGYHVFLDDQYFSAPNLLIAVGLIILLVSFLGCCGAVKENHCMIVSYIALLVLIFILELSGGIAGYVCRDQAHAMLTAKLEKSIDNYGPSDDPVTIMWDEVQRSLQCCGATNGLDWDKAKHGVPLSCCTSPIGQIKPLNCTVDGDGKTEMKAYQAGCVEKLGDVIREKAVVIGGAGITIALIQLLGILMACRLASAMRRAVSELA